MSSETPVPPPLQRPIAEAAGTSRLSAAARPSVAVRDLIDEVLEPARFRRDFNLLRAVLLEAEQPGAHPFMYPSYDRSMVQAHLVLLIEAGFAHGTVVRSGAGVATATIDRLTWSGHDLLALMRDNTVWHRARTEILDAHGCAQTDLLIDWLKQQRKSS